MEPQLDTLEQNPIHASSSSVWTTYLRPAAAEILGTYILVFFGTGAVASGVITQSLIGLGQVASVWGIGVAIAIYCTASTSGAHLNPAVTFAYAVIRKIKPTIAIIYVLSQFIGAVLASCTIYFMFLPFIEDFEAHNGITRGDAGSERSAMIFGEYFPNPAGSLLVHVSILNALFAETLGTCVLMFFIMNITDRCNTIVHKGLAPLLIGMTITGLICVLAPITQAGFNPARDFGPRLIALSAGWGYSIAMKKFWVYIIGPLIGAPLGALLFEIVLKKKDHECGHECRE